MQDISRRGFAFTVLGAMTLRGQPAVEDLADITLAEASRRIHNRTVTATQLTESCLSRIAIYNPKLNAFITVMREQALAQARELDAEQHAGRMRGPLHGIPIALKDNIDTAGVRTTAASAVFDDRVPAEDAEVTRRLKLAGAVLIGKTNLHEFAMGGSSATSYFGPVRNPWALERNPGGSSGGSAAAVAADLCFGALGTDTGGSIRTPAAYCGIVGFKPTYGLVSIRGIIPLVVSLDHCGPLTRTVEDAAMMLNILAGYDKLDIASVEHPKEDYVLGMRQPVSGLRLGIPRAPFFDLLDHDVAKSFDDALKVFSSLTKEVKDVTLPPVRNIQVGAEAFAYHEELFAHEAGRYQIPTRRGLQNGANAKAAEYIQSHWKLELLRRTIDESFTDFDLVALPTRRRTPRTIDASIKREENDKPMNPELENTGPFNVYGIPAISIPCGFNSAGLPIGLMIAGPRFSEARVLALANAYERATDWHTHKPPLQPDTPVPPLKQTEDTP